ncbi:MULTISPECIES: NADP-dependent oxidoreductase [Staphylococcus]|uniref:NADP-dependent oxidoreductase n=1 Tax=Staphylococcus TaxID=1279 RepID=UPI0007D93AFB|nr:MULTISPECIES: NADP-dependent oxidoreductase [Staphylococcus]AQM41431.1 NADP-dependent oxidoreductase [Staphylococcus cohnii]SCS42343.1 NADP-dependent oxidoreductase [Staphylococcus cohnii subsp. cohnii]MBM9447676.1 NADP-dependent oxidoreductase [Staphylococcus ureilyticus]MDK7753426.1 NADP-dependent oxidoreductase [Staphylococcus sp. UMB10092B]MDQ7110998.1 NADP-dependent oxidoreductase [Staphylococcus ureilyticus]
MKTESIVLAKRPEGIPSDDVFRYETVEIDEPSKDEIQIEAIYISVDPYMRGRMDDSKSYIQPFQLDEPLAGHIVGKVIQSNADGFEQGDYVVGMLPWQKHTNVSAQSVTKITQRDIPLYLYLSVLGMTGQTAYHGLLKIGQPKEGETVVVSAASGAVGSVVGQIAKLKGARVVGIAGGTSKTEYLTDQLGFDASVDYKADNFSEQLAQAVPDGVDVYFENVGGHIADEVMKHLNQFARIPVCGAISGYNDKGIEHGPRIQPILIKSQALMKGFVVANYADDFKQASQHLAQWVNEDKIKTKTSIVEGFENVPNAFRNLFTGDNFGKQVVQVSDNL